MEGHRRWDEMSRRTQRILSLSALAIFLIFSVFIFFTVGIPMVRYAEDPQLFRSWIDGMGAWGMSAYSAMCALQVVVAIIPGGPLEMAGGYAFGWWKASILATVGMGAGSAAVFALVRLFGYRFVEAFFPREKINELHFLKDRKKRTILLSLLFILPGTPKDLLCYFCGLTDITFPFFMAVTTLLRVPAIVASALGGSMVVEKGVAAGVMILLVLSLVTVTGVIIYRRIVEGRKEG